MPLVLLRASLVWLLIIGVETVHGIVRTLLLAPYVGDFTARQIAVFTGSLLILLVSLSTVQWIRAGNMVRWLAVGLLWVCLTVVFEMALGRLLLGLSWERMFEDYDLRRGGLLSLGMIFLFVAPLFALDFEVPRIPMGASHSRCGVLGGCKVRLMV